MHNEFIVGPQIVNLEMMISNLARNVRLSTNQAEVKLKMEYAWGLYDQYSKLATEFGLAASEIARVRRLLNGYDEKNRQ